MASVEGRAGYAANCFAQGLKMPHGSCDRQSPVSEKLESDWSLSDSVNDHIHANRNSDKLPGMKWWLHVKTNLEGEANYTCQRLNSWESNLDAVYEGFLDDGVKNFDALSFTGSSNKVVEQPWNVSPTYMKYRNDISVPKIEATLNNNIHLTPMKKDQEEFYFSDGHFMDSDITNFSVSEKSKTTSSDLESHFMGTEKTGPWWRTAGKDELASLVAQKSLEHIENCDLPQPQIKHFRHRPLYPKGVDFEKNLPSSLNQKAEVVSSIADGYTSGTPTSGCSFQDSDRNFSQSKDSASSKKDCQINSENNSMAELMEALCHSQTRAREAEKAAQQAYSEKEHIVSLFFKQASQLFAYKQWYHILQLENLCLQFRIKNQPLLNLFPIQCKGVQLKKSHGRARKRKGSKSGRCGIGACAVAFAVGLGLAGAGLLLGWTMGWMFPAL